MNIKIAIFFICITSLLGRLGYAQNEADSSNNFSNTKEQVTNQQPSLQTSDLLEWQKRQERTLNKQLFWGLAILSFIIFLAGKYFHNQRKKDYQKLWDLLQEEKDSIQKIFAGQEEILIELKNKVNTIERTIFVNQLNYERQQSIIGKVIDFLKRIVNSNQVEQLKTEIQQLSRSLEQDKNRENQWENFTLQIEKIHPNFITKLLNQNSALKSRDLRLCAFIRLGMDNQEIAQILGIANASVIKARHRLKKKLLLEKGLDLNQFLLNL